MCPRLDPKIFYNDDSDRLLKKKKKFRKIIVCEVHFLFRRDIEIFTVHQELKCL